MASLPQLLLERGLVSREQLEVALARVGPGMDPRGGLALALLRERWVDPLALRAAIQAADPGSVAMGRVDAEARPGARLGPYELIREVARGGMGVVYEARHCATGARYAVKTLGELRSEDERGRFRREARLAAALDHPHVARVHAAELELSVPYLVQDLLPGGDLEERVARGGALSWSEGCKVVAKLASAVACAHEHGVLHRDLKPANVLFDQRGEPVLTDFGLARRLNGASIELTQTGEVLGTPAYMAPEQVVDARDAGPACDVYALGGVLFFTLTGRAPFSGPSVWNVLDQVLHQPPPHLGSCGAVAPVALEALLTRVLAKDPGERPSARELADALLEVEHAPRTASLVGSLSTVAGLGVLVAVLAYALGTAPDAGAPSTPRVATPSPGGAQQGQRAAELAERLRSRDKLVAGVAAAELLEDGSADERALWTLRQLAEEGLVLGGPYPRSIPAIAFDQRADRAWLVLNHEGQLSGWDLTLGSKPRWTVSPRPGPAPLLPLSDRISAGRGRLLFQRIMSRQPKVGHEAVLLELGETLAEPKVPPGRLNDFAEDKAGVFLALSPDGARAAFLSRNDGRVRVYDAQEATLLSGEAHRGTLRQVSFHPSGRALFAHYESIAGEKDPERGHLLRWDLERAGAEPSELVVTPSSPSFALAADRLAVSHGNLITLCGPDLSDPRRFVFPSQLLEEAGLKKWLSGRMCLHPREPLLFGLGTLSGEGSLEGIYECWDLAAKRVLWSRPILAGARKPTVSPDGRWLVWLREHNLGSGGELHDLRLFYVGPLPGSGQSDSSRPLKEASKELSLDSKENR